MLKAKKIIAKWTSIINAFGLLVSALNSATLNAQGYYPQSSPPSQQYNNYSNHGSQYGSNNYGSNNYGSNNYGSNNYGSGYGHAPGSNGNGYYGGPGGSAPYGTGAPGSMMGGGMGGGVVYGMQNQMMMPQQMPQMNLYQLAGGGTAGAALQLGQMFTSVYGQYLGQKQQFIMQMIQSGRNQQMLQKMGPQCVNPDGSSCFKGESKFFPECQMPATISNMPNNVCSNAPTMDPMQITSMISYEYIANAWMNHYDKMSNDADNSKVPTGLRCLEDKQKALSDKLTGMINRLTALQDKLKHDSQMYRDYNQKLLRDMAATYDEIAGQSSGQKNLDLKTKQFSRDFTPSCQAVIGQEGFDNASAQGLVGIEKSIEAKNRAASAFNSNKMSIEHDIRRDVEKKMAMIRGSGIDDWLATNLEVSKVKNIEVVTEKEAQKFTASRKRIEGELQKLVGYTAPKMGKDFSVDSASFLKTSEDFFRKKYVNECVNGADRTGVSLSTEQILQNIRQKSIDNTGGGGSAPNQYRDALRKIMAREGFIEDKLIEIKKLEATYNDISVTMTDGQGQLVTKTPYDIYFETIKNCEARYVQTSPSNNNISHKNEVARAQGLLSELKNLHDSFATNLGNKILEKMLNCEGEVKKAGKDCSEALEVTHDNFCISQASQCALEINGCAAEISTQIETRKNKIKQMANQFNKNTREVIQQSNQLYEAQKQAVLAIVAEVQQKLPGSNFEIPTDMFVTTPEEKSDKFETALVNGGDMKFLEELPKKIDKLKEMFKQQQTKGKEVVADYINKQKAAMTKQRERWNTLAKECKTSIDSSVRAMAQMQQQQMMQQQRAMQQFNEQQMMVPEFCRKYWGLMNNPIPACDVVESLAKDTSKVMMTGRINPEVFQVLTGFERVCNGFNNEKQFAAPNMNNCWNLSGADKVSCLNVIGQSQNNSFYARNTKTKKPPLLKNICPKSDTTDSDFFQNVAEEFPEGITYDYISKLKKLSDIDGGSRDIEDHDFLRNLENLVGDKKHNICNTLHEKGSAKDKSSSEDLKKLETELTDLKEKIQKSESEAEKASHTHRITELQDEIIQLQKTSSKNEVNELLALLVPPEESPFQRYGKEFQRIGQQNRGGACDWQGMDIMYMPKDQIDSGRTRGLAGSQK